MKTQNVVIGVLVALTLLFGYLAFSPKSVPAGAANPNGQQHYQQESFQQGATFGARYQSYFDNVGAFVSSAAMSLTSTFKLGSSGTALSRINSGTCYIQPYATTIAATSSVTVDCQGAQGTGGVTTARDTALTGVTPGDAVVVMLGSSTASTLYGGLDLVSATASTSAGYISLQLFNQTGGTYTWSITANASGTASYIATH